MISSNSPAICFNDLILDEYFAKECSGRTLSNVEIEIFSAWIMSRSFAYKNNKEYIVELPWKKPHCPIGSVDDLKEFVQNKKYWGYEYYDASLREAKPADPEQPDTLKLQITTDTFRDPKSLEKTLERKVNIRPDAELSLVIFFDVDHFKMNDHEVIECFQKFNTPEKPFPYSNVFAIGNSVQKGNQTSLWLFYPYVEQITFHPIEPARG